MEKDVCLGYEEKMGELIQFKTCLLNDLCEVVRCQAERAKRRDITNVGELDSLLRSINASIKLADKTIAEIKNEHNEALARQAIKSQNYRKITLPQKATKDGALVRVDKAVFEQLTAIKEQFKVSYAEALNMMLQGRAQNE